MFSASRLFFFGITDMLGVDSCVFNLYDKSWPENQTKRGEIDSEEVIFGQRRPV
jgi:hypothetical protein